MTWARLGPLGGLRDIPNPTPETAVESSRAENTFPLLGGHMHVQRSPRRSRAWRLGHIWQAPELLAYLTACAEGAIPGPLYLHTQDAALTNLLPSDVAAPCRMGTVALGSVAGTVAVGMSGGAVPMSGVVQQAAAGAWSAVVPVRQVAHVLSGWASAAGAVVEWRTVTAAGVQVATGAVTAAAVTGGFYGAVSIVPGATVAGLQVRLAAGSRVAGGLRLVEGVPPDSGPVVEVRRNLCTNPSFEAGLTGWSGGGAATGEHLASASAFVGSYVMRVTRNSATPGNCFVSYDATLPVGTYTWSFYTRIVSGAPTYQSIIAPSGGAAVTGGGAQTVVFAGSSWVRVTRTFTVTTAGAVSLVFRDDGSPLVEVGQAVELDAVLIESAPSALPYFDGSTSPNSDLAASWTGTPNASPSILKTIPEGAVQPGWAPGVGVPQVVVGDPQQTLQLATATEVLSDYTVTIREVGR